MLGKAQDEASAVFGAAGWYVTTSEEEAAVRGGRWCRRRSRGSTRPGGSTFQSLARGADSVETDYLNGEVVALGAAARRADPGERGAAAAGGPRCPRSCRGPQLDLDALRALLDV